MPIAGLGACFGGAVLGAINGALVAHVRIPFIVVTLAAMAALRDGLRWATQGPWIPELPPWISMDGFSQTSWPVVTFLLAGGLSLAAGWALRNLSAGREIYATGSNKEAARLAGIDTRLNIFTVFAIAGALTGLAALL